MIAHIYKPRSRFALCHDTLTDNLKWRNEPRKRHHAVSERTEVCKICAQQANIILADVKWGSK